VQRFLYEVINEIELLHGDIDCACKIIAEAIKEGNFEVRYVDGGSYGQRILIERIRNHSNRE
jgi:hypothetical protein